MQNGHYSFNLRPKESTKLTIAPTKNGLDDVKEEQLTGTKTTEGNMVFTIV